MRYVNIYMNGKGAKLIYIYTSYKTIYMHGIIIQIWCFKEIERVIIIIIPIDRCDTKIGKFRKIRYCSAII